MFSTNRLLFLSLQNTPFIFIAMHMIPNCTCCEILVKPLIIIMFNLFLQCKKKDTTVAEKQYNPNIPSTQLLSTHFSLNISICCLTRCLKGRHDSKRQGSLNIANSDLNTDCKEYKKLSLLIPPMGPH